MVTIAVSHTQQVEMHGGRDGNVLPRHGGKEIVRIKRTGEDRERLFHVTRFVAGNVNDRQDGWITTKTLSTVHGKTFDVPFDSVQRLT